jgi:hypothetical protein
LDAREGRTRLYDSILSAGNMVHEFIQERSEEIDHENVTKRIFVLTDGEDNASSQLPWQVAQYLQQHNILLDAIPLAGNNSILQSLTSVSGGLCFVGVC